MNPLLFVALLFARFCGLFLISPLFSGKGVSPAIRIGVALACSLILFPPALKQGFQTAPLTPIFLFSLFKELVTGYLIGYTFSLIIEAVALAGQWIGTLAGLSVSELFDPQSSSMQPTLTRFYLLLACVLFFTLDLHHPLLKLLYNSFDFFPLGIQSSHRIAHGFIEMSNQLFHQALATALYPLSLLIPLLVFFALLARFIPIFWLGFPIQFIAGLSAIALSAHTLAPILKQAFFYSLEFVNKFIVNY